MHRYYPHGHHKLVDRIREEFKSEEAIQAAIEKQEAAEEVDREKVEAEEYTRALMVMEVDASPRSSVSVLAEKFDTDTPSPFRNGYSLRKRSEKDYSDQKAFGNLLKKRKTEEPKPPVTPKTPKITSAVNTPKTPRSMKNPGPVKTPGTPTPTSCRLSLVVKPGKEAVIENLPIPKNSCFPKFIQFSVGYMGEQFAIPLHYLSLECGMFKSQKYTTMDQMKFPEFESKTFRFFTTWIYSNTFKEGKKIEECSLEFLDLIQLYQIAERFQAVVLKNVALDNMVNLFHYHHGWVQFGLADEVYKGTVPRSPLRRLWVEFRIRGEGVEQGVQQLNGEFLTDVIEHQNKIIQDANRGVGVKPLVAADFYDVEGGTGRIKERVPFF